MEQPLLIWGAGAEHAFALPKVGTPLGVPHPAPGGGVDLLHRIFNASRVPLQRFHNPGVRSDPPHAEFLPLGQ